MDDAHSALLERIRAHIRDGSWNEARVELDVAIDTFPDDDLDLWEQLSALCDQFPEIPASTPVDDVVALVEQPSLRVLTDRDPDQTGLVARFREMINEDEDALTRRRERAAMRFGEVMDKTRAQCVRPLPSRIREHPDPEYAKRFIYDW